MTNNRRRFTALASLPAFLLLLALPMLAASQGNGGGAPKTSSGSTKPANTGGGPGKVGGSTKPANTGGGAPKVGGGTQNLGIVEEVLPKQGRTVDLQKPFAAHSETGHASLFG